MPEFKDIVLDGLEKWIHKEFGNQEIVYEHQVKTLTENERLQNELVEMRLRRLIEDDYFRSKKEDLQIASNQLRLEVGRTEERMERTRKIIEQAMDFRLNARRDFLIGDLHKRREIARSLGVRFLFDNGKVFIELHPLLAYMQSKTDQFEPPDNGSESIEKTFSEEKVPLGAADGTVSETKPLESILNRIFREVWEGRLSFPQQGAYTSVEG